MARNLELMSYKNLVKDSGLEKGSTVTVFFPWENILSSSFVLGKL